MQLGTRWTPGDAPPARLPDVIVAAILEFEATQRDGLAESGRRWTLTWLEGRPVVELDPDPTTGHVTTISAAPGDSTATIASGDPDEVWIEEGL